MGHCRVPLALNALMLQAVFDRMTEGVDRSKLTKQHIVDVIKLGQG